jgi:Icc-related predicted phosphoesterase
MKIIAFSDIHGDLITVKEKCDVVVIAGDIVPLYIQSNMVDSYEWFKHVFLPYIEKLPCKHVVLVPGNHDIWFDEKIWEKLFQFENAPNVPTVENILKDYKGKLIYLKDSGVELDGVKFWGSPWITNLPRWAFNLTKEQQKEKFQLIPKDTDVLVTHTPPFGEVGTVQQDCWNKGRNFGSEALKEVLMEEDCQIKVCISGHIHSGSNIERINNTTCYNVSQKDESYNIHRKPVVIEL